MYILDFINRKIPTHIKGRGFGYTQISEEFPSLESKEAFELLSEEQKSFLKITLIKDCRKRITYPQLEKIEFINNYINNLNL